MHRQPKKVWVSLTHTNNTIQGKDPQSDIYLVAIFSVNKVFNLHFGGKVLFNLDLKKNKSQIICRSRSAQRTC